MIEGIYLLNFIQGLLWPCVILIIFFYLRVEIKALLGSFGNVVHNVSQGGLNIEQPLLGEVKLKGAKELKAEKRRTRSTVKKK
jgi:hypothetical protein